MPEPDSHAPVSPELTGVWDALRAELRTEGTEVTFHIWLEPLSPAALTGGTLYVRAPEHVRTWVEERFHDLIAAAGRRAAGIGCVEIVEHDWTPPAEMAEPAAQSHSAGSG